MIGYITLGTNNFDTALAFYDDLFSSIGASRFLENDKFVAWAREPEAAGFSLTKPFDGQDATVGNGTMIAIALESIEQVQAFYQKAIQLGATDEGEPGYRGDVPGFYAGYFRDLDGNKLNGFVMDTPEK